MWIRYGGMAGQTRRYESLADCVAIGKCGTQDVNDNLIAMSPVGPLLPIQHVRCEVGSLSETGPVVLDARLSHLDPERTRMGASSAAQSLPSPRDSIRLTAGKKFSGGS